MCVKAKHHLTLRSTSLSHGFSGKTVDILRFFRGVGWTVRLPHNPPERSSSDVILFACPSPLFLFFPLM